VVRYFFATANDLLPVFSRVEAKWDVVYTLSGLLESPPLEAFTRGEQLPSLRQPPSGQSMVECPDYLVTPAGVAVQVREVPQVAGGIRYAIDQLVNPDSVTLSHGGSPAPGILLAGRIGTCTGTEASGKLFRVYANAVAKAYVKIKAFWVGPEAREMLAVGCRLTQSADSPQQYDLAP
jgi:hypothetical protein